MPEGSYLYCDVSLPVPIDQPFTYSLPETLRHRVQPGSRLMVPFGSRKLTGVILRCHDERPEAATRDALRLIDAAPVLDAELLSLGRWISGYYCSPLGDVLRGMLPLASDVRQGKVWSLTDAGRDAARQLLLGSAEDDPVTQVLRMLEKRPLSAGIFEEGAAARRKGNQIARAQRLRGSGAGADGARSAARTLGAVASGTEG